MSMNYGFGFSLLLFILVLFNIYFFLCLNTTKSTQPMPSPHNLKLDLSSNIIREIYEYLNYLPLKYTSKNRKIYQIQRNLISSFNTSNSVEVKTIWNIINNWSNEDSLFPHQQGASGQTIRAIRETPLALVDNAPKGTQLKLLLLLEGKTKLYFKPKRYDLNDVITGDIYSGFDRHNSEIFAYYLAMVMNFTWVAPAATRRLHLYNDILPLATPGLKKTMVQSAKGILCIYGKCFYCKMNETVCPDQNGEIEGAAIVYSNKKLRVFKYPWQRSYSKKKMEWETNDNFCNKVKSTIPNKRLLQLIEVSILDFLIQNGDRHNYEVAGDRVMLVDNGKGLGNPHHDALDILAPLYHCCVLRSTVWQHLESLSGGSLTETVKLLSALHGEKLATEDNYKAVERRLLKVYATIQYCIGKHGSAKVFKID